ncbi:zf-MIZ-domain-containing protein [Ceraceosorus guamensis]|uniref:Zf-MIZ-domain-containing protein n=1 Tax=Ceraceosorus guamensis TaxID=1522189 RepID=A0A316VVM8_9BASI|nr:zf-MIZ-domain-containing protein [Ceraceosorus guamensis]PWN39495.1 zf-MIZ-domain-containing protein [Ceraceosorus guamensis]
MAHLAGPSSGGVPWHFHPRILSHIGNNFTVPQLKESLRDLGLRISGNKPELHNRLRDAIQDYYHRGDAARWEMARRVVASQTTNGTFDWMKDIQNAPVKQPAAPGYGGGGGGGAPTGAGAYTPSNVAAATATRSAPATQPNFKPSPFYRIHEWASTSTLLLPCTPSEGRKAALLRMNVRADHAQLVKDQPDKYKYRLFVAPKPAWDASASRTGAAHPCFIDFPFGSELFVNSTKYAGALKGSKKHAGRVPPPDLSKGLLFMDPNKPNSIEVRYQTDRSGSHAPTSHAMAIALCRVTSPEELAANLAKERTHSKEKVIAGMKRAADDDEIEAGAQTFRFKCPLSYMTIKTPARATTCPHVQTFDAGAFYSLNETSPVWQCPVCSSDIRHEDLFVDG